MSAQRKGYSSQNMTNSALLRAMSIYNSTRSAEESIKHLFKTDQTPSTLQDQESFKSDWQVIRKYSSLEMATLSIGRFLVFLFSD